MKLLYIQDTKYESRSKKCMVIASRLDGEIRERFKNEPLILAT